MNELIKVNYENSDKPTVSARDLHSYLEVGSEFSHWFNRMSEYGFMEEIDFSSILTESTGGRPATDYQLTIDTAKEICMLQRNEKGKQARQYFIQLEKNWNSPEMVLNRAVIMADQRIKQLSGQVQELQPKADYYDKLIDRNGLTSFRDTAKLFEVKEREFINMLISKNYIYRDQKKKLRAYAEKNDGLFALKEYTNADNENVGCQTLIIAKGRDTFRRLVGGAQ